MYLYLLGEYDQFHKINLATMKYGNVQNISMSIVIWLP